MFSPLRIFALLLLSSALFAQPTALERAALPFGTAADASRLRATRGLKELREIVERIIGSNRGAASELFLAAELLKQLGDARAAEYYAGAIAADESEPAYELFAADYYRNFRGPRRPLFAEAERHYFAALRKLRRRAAALTGVVPEADLETYRGMVLDRIDRGLVALYQEDGVPALWNRSGEPLAFLGLADRFAESTADLDEIHDTRDFTSEALLAATRLGRSLSDEELRAIVRIKEPQETFARVRVRYGAMPVLELFHRRRNAGSAQITDFNEPRKLNDVELRTVGLAVEKTMAARMSDLYMRAALSRLDRRGVVETLPRATEEILQADLQAAASRFVGPDKWILELRYSLQNIEPDLPVPPQRNRRIAGATAEYQLLRPLPFLRDPYGQLFETRGIHFFGGFANDRERFDDVLVTRRDLFLGTSVRGLGRFDITLQPGYIDAHVSSDRSQSNAQIRTDLTVLVRLLDEERQPGIPETNIRGFHPAFVHLVFPFKRDISRTGPDALENYKAGVALHAKLFRRSFAAAALRGEHPSTRPATILASLRYERQRFPRLGEDLQLLGLSISLGY